MDISPVVSNMYLVHRRLVKTIKYQSARTEWIQPVTFQLHNLYKYLTGLSSNENFQLISAYLMLKQLQNN